MSSAGVKGSTVRVTRARSSVAATGCQWPHTLPAERYQPWLDRLLAMSWDDSEHRKILELEGLRRWVPPHLDGYKPLFEAVQEQGIDPRW